MTVEIDPTTNPFGGKSPFDVLGVTSDADARQIRDALEQKLEDLEYEQCSPERKIERRNELNKASEALRDARNRLAVEFMLYDTSVGKAQCKSAAQRHRTMTFDFGRILQGAQDMFPRDPSLDWAQQDKVCWKMEASLRLCEPSERFRPDPKAEIANSITFDR